MTGLRRAGSCLPAALILCAASATAWGGDPAEPINPLKNRFLTGKSLDVCDQGSFFVGGVPKVVGTGSSTRQTIIGAMYTQFQIPTKRRKWPIIFVHGGNYTGSALEASANGNEGWMSMAVRNNYATFVVDRPGYGRSGFDSTVINEARAANNLSLLPSVAESTSDIWFNTGQRGFGLIVPPGSSIIDGTMIRHGDPGDPRMPETDPPSDFHGAYPPAFPIPPVESSIDGNIRDRVGAIGPTPNPVNNAYLALNAYKYVVPGMDSLFPGSTCSTCTPTSVAPGNTWAPLALAELVERLGGAILAPHSQSSDNVLHTIRLLKLKGKLDLVKGVIVPETTAGGAVTPFPLERYGLVAKDFDTIPYFIFSGDYRITSIRESNRSFIDQINSTGTRKVRPAAYYDLDAPGMPKEFLGTTHIVQTGTNNAELFDFMAKWAEKNISNPIVKHSCPPGRDRDKH